MTKQRGGGLAERDAPERDAPGSCAYQFDAWSRLIQVNEASLVAGGVVPGPLVKHQTYDALGRLARTQSPWPTPQEQQDGEVRTERFYYDGIRRAQEVFTDPIQDTEEAAAGGESAAASALADEPNLDASACRLGHVKVATAASVG